MGKSVSDYILMLKALMPIGKAWNKDSDSGMHELIYGMADELERIDQTIDYVLEECNTKTTSDLIKEHELDLGLPNNCSRSNPSVSERRALIRTKTLACGPMTPAAYINWLSQLGYTATITEYTPAWSGMAISGDPCGDQWVIFCWTIHVNKPTAPDTDILSEIMCEINKHRPAHTIMEWDWMGFAYDYGFNTSFDSSAWSWDSSPDDYLSGAFRKDFNIAFDTKFGGSFEYNELSLAFDRPA